MARGNIFRKAVPDWMVSVRYYARSYGRLPNLFRPQTFNEKLLHRLVFDRREVLAEVTDKFRLRAYVASRLEPSLLPELYHVTDNPEDIPFEQLPDRFVLKPNHGSGWIHVVPDKAKLDRDAVIALCRSWLRQNYYELTREWVYKHITPKLMIEEFVDDGSGGIPTDYKFYAFDGLTEVIQVDTGRFGDHRRGFYTPSWEKLALRYGRGEIIGEIPRPRHFEAMLQAAKILGRDLDFVRVDFYDTPRRPYLGELTATPAAATNIFGSRDYERYLGKFWRLPRRGGGWLHRLGVSAQGVAPAGSFALPRQFLAAASLPAAGDIARPGLPI
jgi:teichuronopeptide biosynthesis TupA-like protein